MAVEVPTPPLKLIREADGLAIDLLPIQGHWSEAQYLMLTDATNALVEFTAGTIEILPLPTDEHQVLLAYLYELLLIYIRPRGGKVLFAPLRLRIQAGKFREPDLVLVRDADDPRRQNRYWLEADLVVEIISPDDPTRDTVTKRRDYAVAGIPEYWIVDPVDETLTVLTLIDEEYVEHGIFHRGATATSVVLDGCTLQVNDLFDAT